MALVFVNNPGNDVDIQPNAQSAINSANIGDTIVFPAGSFIVSGSMTTTKFLSFSGAGISATTLYRSETTNDSVLENSWGSMFYVTTNSRLSSNITISDMWMKSKLPSLTGQSGFSGVTDGSIAADFGIKFTKCVDFIVTRCRFEYFGFAAIIINHYDDLARGLIYNNQFYHNAKGADGLGVGYGVDCYGENLQWVPKPKFGSSNFIFIEDNFFDFHRHAIAAGGCGLYVARHNTINDNIMSKISTNTAAIDGHGARGGIIGNSNYFSARSLEIYENIITNTTDRSGNTIVSGGNAADLAASAIFIRGGEALVWNNTINGYRFGIMLYLEDSEPFGTNYPIPYMLGYLSGLKYGSGHTGNDARTGNGDPYIWNNTFTPYVSSGGSSSQTVYNFYPQYFTVDRDWHTGSTKPFYMPFIYPHPSRKKTISF